jgi:hypothetical protein
LKIIFHMKLSTQWNSLLKIMRINNSIFYKIFYLRFINGWQVEIKIVGNFLDGAEA